LQNTQTQTQAQIPKKLKTQTQTKTFWFYKLQISKQRNNFSPPQTRQGRLRERLGRGDTSPGGRPLRPRHHQVLGHLDGQGDEESAAGRPLRPRGHLRHEGHQVGAQEHRRQADRRLLGSVAQDARRHEVPGVAEDVRQEQHPAADHEADPRPLHARPGLRPRQDQDHLVGVRGPVQVGEGAGQLRPRVQDCGAQAGGAGRGRGRAQRADEEVGREARGAEAVCGQVAGKVAWVE